MSGGAFRWLSGPSVRWLSGPSVCWLSGPSVCWLSGPSVCWLSERSFCWLSERSESKPGARLTLLAVCVLLLSTGCMSVTGVPHPEQAGAVRAVSYIDLLAAPVPELCAHEPGRFANGVLPLQDPRRGIAQIAVAPQGFPNQGEPQVAYGDLTGDGVPDAVMVAECTAGGVGWPPVVNLYTAGDVRLGSVDLGDLPGQGGRGPVRTVSIAGGRVHLTWSGYRDADAGCCPTLPMSGELVWNGTSVEATNVRER